MMTIFRQLKDDVHWYPSELRSEPYLHVANEWKADIKKLTVYSNAEEIELVVNGKAIAKDKPSADTAYIGLDHPPFIFEIKNFEAGELKVKAFVKGEFMAEKTIFTPEKQRR